MLRTLISILLSILTSELSILISRLSVISVPRALTKYRTFAGGGSTFAGVPLRLPVGLTFAGMFQICEKSFQIYEAILLNLLCSKIP